MSPEKRPGETAVMELGDILSAGAVFAPLKVQSKKRLFQEMAHAGAATFDLDEATVLSALLDRESLGPTGVGRGIAIPHARIPDLDGVCGMFFLLETPVDFESVDRKPVDLVFVLLAPEGAGADHLKALARVSRTLRDDQTCAKLRSTTDAQALYAILTEAQASQAA